MTRCSIDLLVITHDDTDHHNGVPFLLQRVHVRRAIMPASLRGTELCHLLIEHGCDVLLLQPGEQSQPLPAVRVLAPDLPVGASDNDLSLWVQLQVRNCNILLAGDAQELGTAAALASGFVSRCDVLLLPHHGRRNANAAHLLRRARPRACLASASSGDGATLQGDIARRFGTEVWSTGMHGTITISGVPIEIHSQQPASRR